MERVYFNARWHTAPAQSNLMGPTKKILLTTPPLRSKSNKPLAMTTDAILNILVYYHLNEFSSGRELLQHLEEDEYARHLIAPAGGVKRSTFFDTVNERCVEQLLHLFSELQKQAASILPTRHIELGELVAVDGSFIDSVLSMTWAEYQTQSNKAKLHLGFDLTHGIPKSLILTEGNSATKSKTRHASSSTPIRRDHAADRIGNEGTGGKYMQFPNRTLLGFHPIDKRGDGESRRRINADDKASQSSPRRRPWRSGPRWEVDGEEGG